MWTRAELKMKAKGVLKLSYWKAFLVSIVIAVVGGSAGGGGGSFNWSTDGGRGSSSFGDWGSGGDSIPVALIVVIIIIAVIIFLLALSFRIFLGAPLEVGGRKYFVRSVEGDYNMNELGYSFRKGVYGDVVKTMLWAMFLNFLWFLLLVIPGIVKSYAYRMVPYLLADNPNLGMRRAVQLSNQMTSGEKWRMFVLDLSFIGWFLLGMLALFVGTLFVLPYYNATQAELYAVLRRQAIDRGLTSTGELGLE